MFSKASRTSEPLEVEGRGPSGKAKDRDSAPSIVSSGLRITGDLVSDSDVQIDGIVEGNVSSRSVAIGESGAIIGKVAAERLHVAGSITGEIRASIVDLTCTARVAGDLHHDTLSIEAGALLEGLCRRIKEVSSARAETPRSETPVNLVVNEGEPSAS